MGQLDRHTCLLVCGARMFSQPAVSKATLFLGYLFLLSIKNVRGSDVEYELITSLLKTYDSNVRPVSNVSEKITVHINIGLSQLIDMDDRDQILTIKVYVRLKWHDSHLVWKKEEYDGLTDIRIGAETIWKPDITLYTNLGGSLAQTFPVTVHHTGELLWNFPAVIRTTCSVKVKYFPWDQQECPLKFGSWTYSGADLDIVNSSAAGDVSDFTRDGEWELMGVPLRKHNVYYDCCSDPYPDVTFWIVMRRKPHYYLFNLLLPCVFITGTVILVFYLPPESGEKVTLGVTGLLALTFFQLLVAEALPPLSDSIPLVGSYFGSTIALLALSTCMPVIILNIKHRRAYDGEVPAWVRTFILTYLARLMFLKETVDANLQQKPLKRNDTKKKEEYVECEETGEVKPTGTSDIQPYIKNSILEMNALPDIRGFLSKMRAQQVEQQKTEYCINNWNLVSVVLDRFFLFLFATLTIAISPSLLLSFPDFVEFNVDSYLENTD